MTVLSENEISMLVTEFGLIEKFEASSLERATYDMRLGEEYARQGAVARLADAAPSLVLQPGDFALLTTHEELVMTLDLVAHLGLASQWARRGLVSLFSPQVD